MDRILLNLKDVCDSTGWGKTYAREVLKNHENDFTVRCGNRLYVIRPKFEEYLSRCAKYQIPVR